MTVFFLRIYFHLKAIDSGKFELRGQRDGIVFIQCQKLLNTAHLLHNEGLGRFVSLVIEI